MFSVAHWLQPVTFQRRSKITRNSESSFIFLHCLQRFTTLDPLLLLIMRVGLIGQLIPRRQTERGGPIRSQFLDHRSVRQALFGQLDKDVQLRTDNSVVYRKILPDGQHEFVDHSKGEYVRGDAHTNTLEGFFSVFKRGLVGIYQHIDEKHIDRYLAEFDFRYNNRAKLGISDEERTDRLIRGIVGKRLTYREIRS